MDGLMHGTAGKGLKRDLVMVFVGLIILVTLGAFLRPYYVPGHFESGGAGPSLLTRAIKSGVRFAFGVTYFRNRKYVPFPLIYGIGILLLIVGGARFLGAARGIGKGGPEPQEQTASQKTSPKPLWGLSVALASLLLVILAQVRLVPFGLSFIFIWLAIILSARALVTSTGSDYASRATPVLAIVTILSLLPLVSSAFQFAYPSGIYLGWRALCPWLLLAVIALLGTVLADSILESEMRPPDASAFAMALAGYGASMTAWFMFRLGTAQ